MGNLFTLNHDAKTIHEMLGFKTHEGMKKHMDEVGNANDLTDDISFAMVLFMAFTNSKSKVDAVTLKAVLEGIWGVDVGDKVVMVESLVRTVKDADMRKKFAAFISNVILA